MMFRFLRGPALITAVIRTFESLVAHIERGIAHTADQIVATEQQIADLTKQRDQLQGHADRGLRFAAKLREIIG